ncbi:phosphoribosylformylglycinamidine synthase subunit PurL [Streptomyces albus]
MSSQSLDTVKHAEQTPDTELPWAELGLKEEEYARIREILGRRPTGAELAMYSVMWSEHCSYKSSKVHLRQFGEKAPTEGPGAEAMLVGIGEQAGVVDVGQGYAVTFKVESHNHPSYVEPYQGAATGIGGIVRDIIAMGARPVAVMDPLRFGAADHPDTKRVLPGVVAGIGGYGNCLGLPNIGGEVVFDDCYQGNPLVNALCVGVMKHEDIHLAKAAGTGNKVILYGARTGGDGIGGASILASETFDDEKPSKRPAVQVGDPFQEKLLIECTLEAFHAGLVVGIQDLGAAGLSCATSELASNGSGGMRVELDDVPLRAARLLPLPGGDPDERVAGAHVRRGRARQRGPLPGDLLREWEVTATVIGEVTDGDRLEIFWHGEKIVDVDPKTVAHEGPVYERPYARPEWQDALQADDPAALPRPKDGDELRAAVLALVSSPNQAAKSWITDQYDRYVLGDTVLAQPEDSGMIRIDAETGLGVAVSTDGNGRYAKLDPYEGARLALAESYRNVAATGARPLAVTDCLNFGSPEDPAAMWQFAEACRGLADACRELGTPVTGGNVSLYNQTGEAAIHPTPVVGVLGVIDDVARRTPMAFRDEGHLIYLLGETREELGGSAWSQVAHGHLGGRPPQVDLERERLLAEILIAASRDGMADAAHDVSDGGVVQALAESCLKGGKGARIVVPDGLDPFVFLFSESQGRALVAIPRSEEVRFTDMCAARGMPAARIGVVDGEAIEVQGQFTLPLEELREAHEGTLPRLFG